MYPIENTQTVREVWYDLLKTDTAVLYVVSLVEMLSCKEAHVVVLDDTC